MSKICTALILSAALTLTALGKELKVLMIGNSFSICVTKQLPRMVASSEANKLLLVSAYISGCPLRRHVENIKKGETDSSFAPYLVTTRRSGDTRVPKNRRSNINALLQQEDWDIVTIQQASPESFDYKNYQPFADELIAHIRKYAPKAEIVIQQTWSYRADSPRLAAWKMNQNEMFQKIEKAYAELAKKHNLRIIPMGLAVQCYRKNAPQPFRIPSPEALEKFTPPQLPSTAGDVVGSYRWSKAKQGEKTKITVDPFHLNGTGEYLQALIWNAVLFGTDPEKVAFVPGKIPPDEAALCRKSAAEALKTHRESIGK